METIDSTEEVTPVTATEVGPEQAVNAQAVTEAEAPVAVEPRQPRVGDAVLFSNSVGRDFNALLTAVWGQAGSTDGVVWQPCVNIVFVSGDESRCDGYGRQIERVSSVQHAGQVGAVHGQCWRFEGEAKNEYEPPFEQ